MIKEEYLKSLKNYTSDSELFLTMWSDIEKNYTKPGRHYHNLTHLDNLVSELNLYKDKFASWDTVVFAIAYHDIIYNTLKNNNEEKSAAFAAKKLIHVSFPEKLTTICAQLILATKGHEVGNLETNLFTDADLSILGTDPETYKTYAKQIRQEYAIYPDIVYNPGRKKVLSQFLEMERIYKTNDFSIKYESTARVNIQTELNSMKDGTF